MITTTKVEDFFAQIKDKDIESYNDYWGELKPQSKNAVFRRYLFAFMSVHTTWENNCRGYNAIKKFNDWSLEKTDQLQLWNYDADKLFDFIKTTRVGLQNNRTNFIGTFYDKFLDDPSDYISRSDSETWTQWRDRLAKKILGLGKAKTSFAIEMLFPLEAQVVCMDTHLFQIYGLNQTKHAKLYNEIEGDWLNRSKERGLAPYMARCLYWDKNQNRKKLTLLEQSIGEMMNNIKEIISEVNEDALFADGFDDAIIGHDSDLAVVYDYNKCLKILQDRDGMTENEADEYMEFNVIGAYVGIYTPVFVNLIKKEK